MIDRELQKQLQEILETEKLPLAPQTLFPFSRDVSGICSSPSLLLQPQTTTQIARIVSLAHKHHFPLTIRGGDTAPSGGAMATRGGILLSLSKMSRITEISSQNMMAVVQPGVITAQINAQLRPHGLFYPIDPSSQDLCTIGGNVATRAHGLRGIKYGTIDNYLLGLEAVVPPGEIIRCGAKTIKCATGYRLTDLLAGSRGQIGIITEIILKLLPRPQAQVSLMATFGGMGQAYRVKEVLQKKGIRPSRMELMDHRSAHRGLVDLNLPLSSGQALLLVELDGEESMVQKDAQMSGKLLVEPGGEGVRLAQDEKESDRWWQARGTLLSHLTEQEDAFLLLTTIIPEAKATRFFQKVAEASPRKGADLAIFGHLGEERWHSVISAKKHGTTANRALPKLVETIHKIAASLGGRTCPLYAIGFAAGAFPPPPGDAVAQMLCRTLKASFDPRGILQPME